MGKFAAGTVLIALLVLGDAVAAEESARLSWDHEGYAALPDAAAAARQSGKRLLLGLSGSPT